MLSANQIMKIESEVKGVATRHLNVKDINTALSHYTDDAIAISNTKVFPNREELAAEIGEYYKILKCVFRIIYMYGQDIGLERNP